MSRAHDSGPSAFDRTLWALAALVILLPFVLMLKLVDALRGD